MSRLLSVALTEAQVLDQSKTVTRRLGWWTDKNGRRLLKPGDTLTLCRKVQGRKPGEPLVRLAEVLVVSLTRERLSMVTAADVTREGFPGWDPAHFIDFFTDSMGCGRHDWITRIEWRYL